MTDEQIANAILTAAGSSLRHHTMPLDRERILDAAADIRVAIIAAERAGDDAEDRK